jgi:hypothetical protein
MPERSSFADASLGGGRVKSSLSRIFGGLAAARPKVFGAMDRTRRRLGGSRADFQR